MISLCGKKRNMGLARKIFLALQAMGILAFEVDLCKYFKPVLTLKL
jgi:hypothetical protein